MQQIQSSKISIAAWCLYDWGIAAFPVIVATFIFSTYFTSKIAPNAIVGTKQWGNAMALSAIVIAILSPILGSIADYSGRRKRWLALFTGILIISTSLLWFAYPRVSMIYWVLACVVFATVGLNVGSVFYNAMLTSLVTPKQFGRISGFGWGLGYFGGLSILLIAYYGFVHHAPSWLNQSTSEPIRILGPLVAVWILVFAWPLFVFVPEHVTAKKGLKLNLKHNWSQICCSFKILWHDKNLLLFFCAQMVYLDGLNTLFAFSGIYAAGTFNMSMSDVLLFGIALNMSAGTGSVILAFATDAFGAKRMILLSLMVLIVFGLGIVLTHSKVVFWCLCCCSSFFVGALQSASRTLLAQLVPKNHESMMFGVSALSGKISAFAGPLLFGVMTDMYQSQRVGMASVLVFFVTGALLLGFCQRARCS